MPYVARLLGSVAYGFGTIELSQRMVSQVSCIKSFCLEWPNYLFYILFFMATTVPVFVKCSDLIRTLFLKMHLM